MLIGISDQMGTRFDRLWYEVFQNLILSPMNTGLLRPAVATVLTVYGIETTFINLFLISKLLLQQCLPFTVLKPKYVLLPGISQSHTLQQCLPFTVLKLNHDDFPPCYKYTVATVLTVYGIETYNKLSYIKEII